MISIRTARCGLPICLLAAVVACSDEKDPVSIPRTPPAPNTFALTVKVATTGPAQDPDGYVARVGTGAQRIDIGLATNATGTITMVRGTYTVELIQVADNCIVANGGRRVVTAAPSDTALMVEFNVNCNDLGSMHLTVATTGVDHDPDGYRFSVHGTDFGYESSHQTAATGNVVLDRLPPRSYVIQVHGLAANCRPDRFSQSSTVPGAGTITIAFQVTCAPLTRLAFSSKIGSGELDIFTVEANGTRVRQLTDDIGNDVDPSWSPNGEQIAFASNRHGQFGIYTMNADGSYARRISPVDVGEYQPSWSPDGNRIVFVSEVDGDPEIYVMDADGSNRKRLTNLPGRDSDPAWSPDGNSIAFTSRRSGTSHINLMGSDGSNLRRLTTGADWEIQPAWSPNGSLIAFVRVRCELDQYFYDGDDGLLCRHDVLVSARTGGPPVVVGQGAEPVWSPDGRQIAATSGSCETVGDQSVKYCGSAGISIVSSDPGELADARYNPWTWVLNGTITSPSWRR